MPHPFTENASLNPMKGEIDMDDSNIHIVKRTDQWKERAIQSYVIPRGVLCVELTPDGNTRIKVGEGNKYYSQLPYIGLNIDISQYFTKEEVKKLVQDTSEETVIAYMDKQPYVRVLGPILPSAASLPKSGNKDGDIRFVQLAKVTADGKAYIEYVWFNNRWDPLSTALDIDVSKFATKEELAAVQKTANELAKRVTLLEQAKHIHLNKSIIDSITAPFTTELAAKLSGIEPNANKYVLPIATRHSLGGIIIGEGLLIDGSGRVSVDTSGIVVPPYDDTEVKRRISNLENVAHTHTNKAILDATTASYTTAEKSKLAGLENYDDTALSGRVTTLEESSHTHTNKSVLDNTTASYTTEEQTKLAGLENYTLPIASANTLGGVKVGDGLSIDQDGILSSDGSTVYRAGAGISIETASGGDPSIYDTTHPYYSDTQTSAILDCPGRRRTYTRTTTNPAYVVISRVKNTGGSPYYWYTVYVISKNINDTLCNFLDSDHFSGRSSTADAVSVTIDGTTWYGNGYMISLGDIDPVGDVNEVVPYFESEETSATDTVAAILDYIYSDDTSKYIVNTGVLDVTKNASGNLVVSKESGDTTITLPQEYTLPTASANDLGGIKVGSGLEIDQNGVLSATGGGGTEYTAGDGINIRTESTSGDYDTSSEYYFIDETVICNASREFTLTSERAALPKYGFVAINYLNQNWCGPILISKDPEAVKYNASSYTSSALSFTYNDETWYRSDNGYWNQRSGPSSSNVPTMDCTNVDDNNVVAFICSFLDTLHPSGTVTQNIIENTGVLEVTVDNGVMTVTDKDGDTRYNIGGGGSSTEYVAGDGISIVTGGQIVTDLSSANWGNYADMYDGQRSPTYDSRTFKLRYLHIEPGTQFKINLIPTNPNDTIYWYLYGYDNDAASTGGLHFGQSSDPNDWDTDCDYVYTMPTGKSSLDITVRINNPGYQQGDEVTLSKFDEMQYITGTGPTTKTINVTPATIQEIGGVKVGPGLSVTSDGTLTANVGVEYVAGDGITINQGSTESTDITDLQWEQGSINPVNGEPDDLTTTVIRSPMIEVGLTNMLNVSAQDTSDNDMRWEAAFYDSNSEFISMVTTWQTLSDEVVRPDNAKYVVILLRKESETEIDENALKACEISWPIEIGKYVVTNTGVTHVGLTDDGSVIYVENGSTNTLLTFGQDLDVTNGVVSIPDYHRLVLNVEE